MLTEAIHDYIQRTFDERRLMEVSLIFVLTPYAELVLHKRMQKSVRLGIACGHAIAAPRHSNIHELLDMVKIYYRADVFQTAYQTQTVHPLPPSIRMRNTRPFDYNFIANVISINYVCN
uniref:Uncharacterized protein n=1 Tax=Lactuca sativa TaxID=4236 RepID=A0A9R1X2G1_LACSA|nr:hypothetical protein LSAT_V11C700351680 [Lactuca sativa]